MLGTAWGDWAYELVVRESPPRTKIPLQSIYAVFLDGEGAPVLAPDNMQWDRLWAGRIEPRKLEPDPSDTELIRRLAESGPFADTESIRDPRTEADGGWRIEVGGDSPDGLGDVARETFARACRAFRMRGAVTSRFRPVRLDLDGDRVRVYFHWAENPNVFAMTFRLPMSESDFRGPPLHNPAAVVGTILMDWMEELDTGLIVRGTRRRVDGVLHISAPQPGRTPNRDYAIDGVPLHDRSGVWLATEGLDIRRARAAKDDGVLAAWLQAYENNREGRPYVGHAAARWIGTDVARVDVLELVQGCPDRVAGELMWSITHTLADLGAVRIETPFDQRRLAELGFAPVGDEGWVLDVRTMP
ncbi:hypothetical protein EGT67_24265 [Prescottella agglutinans]|uniref:Uncharacterized protein n=1 Tax=Prescottella agglutinans TaxID=1644129 RepID=A0A3S3E747_9NOCA|nr:hypothetical protein [Prescottella agglutinans]RVW06892.1 hypothetical protein EGT67_24265 [Prescottella agglutinans]